MEVQNMKDKELTCKECGAKFIWTAGEQEFYQEHDFKDEPKRCKACREKAKLEHGRKPFKKENQFFNNIEKIYIIFFINLQVIMNLL